MSVSSWPKNDTNCYLNVYDGGSASIVRVPYVEGDVKISGLMKICNAPIEGTARGGFLGTGYGDPTYPTITFSERVTALTSSAAPGPLSDFFGQIASYSANVSTFGAGKPYAIHIELVQKGSAYGDPDDTLKLWNVQFPGYDLALGKPNTRSWTGTVKGVPGFWGGSVGGAGTIASLNGGIASRRIDQDGN